MISFCQLRDLDLDQTTLLIRINKKSKYTLRDKRKKHWNIIIWRICLLQKCTRDLICIKKLFVLVRKYSTCKSYIVLVSLANEFIFTMSVDGYLKFWKKTLNGIEFIKTFRAHLGKITGASLSSSETRLGTVCSKDGALKVFDVVNFDMMHKIQLKFTPDQCEFIHKASSFSSVIAISE